jgi:hypothetical protein
MKQALVFGALVAAVAFAATAWSSAPPTPTEKKLQREVTLLQSQVKALQKTDKTVEKDISTLQLAVAGVALLGACDVAITADALQGTWQVIDQVSAATQAGKTYFGAQTPLSDTVAGTSVCQALGITRSQVVPPVITPFDTYLALFRG